MKFESGDGITTKIGYENSKGQVCKGTLGVSGTDYNQFAYKVVCNKCGIVYGANGTDIYERNCPNCQGGAAGIRYWLNPEEI